MEVGGLEAGNVSKHLGKSREGFGTGEWGINLVWDRLSLRSLWDIQGKILMDTEPGAPEKVLPGDTDL